MLMGKLIERLGYYSTGETLLGAWERAISAFYRGSCFLVKSDRLQRGPDSYEMK